MERDILLFDLDGTLTDPMVGITKSVQYALRHYGIIEDDLKKLVPFIGPPLMDSFQKYYAFSKEQAREGVLIYREYFSKKGIFENKEIPGIREMLKTCVAMGKSFMWQRQSRRFMPDRSWSIFLWNIFFALSAGRIWEK